MLACNCFPLLHHKRACVFEQRLRPRGPLKDDLLELVLASLLAGSESARETKLRADTVDAVDVVEVLDDDHLEAGGTALAGGNDGPRKEEFPDL